LLAWSRLNAGLRVGRHGLGLAFEEHLARRWRSRRWILRAGSGGEYEEESEFEEVRQGMLREICGGAGEKQVLRCAQDDKFKKK